MVTVLSVELFQTGQSRRKGAILHAMASEQPISKGQRHGGVKKGTRLVLPFEDFSSWKENWVDAFASRRPCVPLLPVRLSFPLSPFHSPFFLSFFSPVRLSAFAIRVRQKLCGTVSRRKGAEGSKGLGDGTQGGCAHVGIPTAGCLGRGRSLHARVHRTYASKRCGEWPGLCGRAPAQCRKEGQAARRFISACAS